MKLPFSLLPALVLFSIRATPLTASPAYSGEDSNIVISNKTERYSFEEGEQEHPVIIRQEHKTTYYCSELRSSIPWIETYDGQSRIDGVKIYVNGSRDKSI